MRRVCVWIGVSAAEGSEDGRRRKLLLDPSAQDSTETDQGTWPVSHTRNLNKSSRIPSQVPHLQQSQERRLAPRPLTRTCGAPPPAQRRAASLLVSQKTLKIAQHQGRLLVRFAASEANPVLRTVCAFRDRPGSDACPSLEVTKRSCPPARPDRRRGFIPPVSLSTELSSSLCHPAFLELHQNDVDKKPGEPWQGENADIGRHELILHCFARYEERPLSILLSLSSSRILHYSSHYVEPEASRQHLSLLPSSCASTPLLCSSCSRSCSRLSLRKASHP